MGQEVKLILSKQKNEIDFFFSLGQLKKWNRYDALTIIQIQMNNIDENVSLTPNLFCIYYSLDVKNKLLSSMEVK